LNDSTSAAQLVKGAIEALSRDVTAAMQTGLDVQSRSIIDGVASKLSDQKRDFLEKVPL
jgi:hypothetical protein